MSVAFSVVVFVNGASQLFLHSYCGEVFIRTTAAGSD